MSGNITRRSALMGGVAVVGIPVTGIAATGTPATSDDDDPAVEIVDSIRSLEAAWRADPDKSDPTFDAYSERYLSLVATLQETPATTLHGVIVKLDWLHRDLELAEIYPLADHIVRNVLADVRRLGGAS